MNKSDFQALVDQLTALSVEQREAVHHQLDQLSGGDGVAELAAMFSARCTSCPYCGGTKLYRYGQAHGLARYRCRACSKTFNPLTGTPLTHLRLRHKWLSYHQCLLNSLTIRKSADAVDISHNTSFRWRHRFLAWVNNDRPARLHGIAEADDIANRAKVRWRRHPARHVKGTSLRAGGA